MALFHSVSLAGQGWLYVRAICVCGCGEKRINRVRADRREWDRGKSFRAFCPRSGSTYHHNVVNILGDADAALADADVSTDTGPIYPQAKS